VDHEEVVVDMEDLDPVEGRLRRRRPLPLRATKVDGVANDEGAGGLVLGDAVHEDGAVSEPVLERALLHLREARAEEGHEGAGLVDAMGHDVTVDVVGNLDNAVVVA
jgi:hypothetical protein